jgi:hypothetical protein
MSDTLAAVTCLVIGVLTVLGAIMDWDWIMNNRRSRLAVKGLGRKGARVLYAGLGVIIALLGVIVLIGG